MHLFMGVVLLERGGCVPKLMEYVISESGFKRNMTFYKMLYVLYELVDYENIHGIIY